MSRPVQLQLPGFELGRGPGPCTVTCRKCLTVGRLRNADCGECRRDARTAARRRYWHANGMDRNGAPR